MVDFHSHILPNVDDGSTSLEMSLSMLETEGSHGIKTVVATPHFYPMTDTPERFLERRQSAAETLLRAAESRPDLPKVVLGAEVAYFRGMSDSEALWKLRIADTNYILVEPPLAPWDRQVFKDLRDLLTKQNLFPIVAHVDRYMMPFWWKKMMKQLAELPVLLQVNSSFFQGKWAKTALRLLDEERIHLLGSDCHNLSTRPPNLGALQSILTKDRLEQIQSYEQMVLGEENE